MLELAVWYFLATLLTIIPVHVGVNIAPVKSRSQSKGITVHKVFINPIGKAKRKAKKPKKAHSFIALSKFSPLYPPM